MKKEKRFRYWKSLRLRTYPVMVIIKRPMLVPAAVIYVETA
jgi:hypothetical protein